MPGKKKGREAEPNEAVEGVPDTMHAASTIEPKTHLEYPNPRADAAPAVIAFDQFYAENYRQLTKALSLALGSWQLGVEATDEAMARAYQRWSKISKYDSPAGWVYRVGLNWGRSNLRRTMRGLNPLYTPPTVAEPEIVDVDLYRAIGTLSTDHRAVVVSRYLLDWSVAETAQNLQMREGTVKSRLHRALKELEQELNLTNPPGEQS